MVQNGGNSPPRFTKVFILVKCRMIAKLSHSSCEKLQKMAESLESGPMKDPIVAFVRGHQVKHKATNFSPRSSIHSFPNPSGCRVPQSHCGCTGSHRGLFWRQMCHRCPAHRQMLSLSPLQPVKILSRVVHVNNSRLT